MQTMQVFEAQIKRAKPEKQAEMAKSEKQPQTTKLIKQAELTEPTNPTKQAEPTNSTNSTNPTKLIYWGVMRSLENNFLMAATDEGLIYLQFHEGDPAGGVDENMWSGLTKWSRTQFPNHDWVEDAEMLQPYILQLEEYLKGQRQNFTLPLDLRGTAFQQAVWRVLHEIPHGETVSYSQVAQELDKLSAVRAVGTAIGANPILIVVPCHRVVGKNGSLTGYRGGLRNKEKLLLLERAGL